MNFPYCWIKNFLYPRRSLYIYPRIICFTIFIIYFYILRQHRLNASRPPLYGNRITFKILSGCRQAIRYLRAGLRNLIKVKGVSIPLD